VDAILAHLIVVGFMNDEVSIIQSAEKLRRTKYTCDVDDSRSNLQSKVTPCV
jgi:hypothetical protein